MYTDLLTRIKNAQQAKKEKIRVPYSKVGFAILEILSKHDLIGEIAKKGRPVKRNIEIKLKYNDGGGAISGIKFVSKPSRRIYAGYAELRPIKQGYGLGIISTPKGIMTTKDAKKMKVGGELLFEIW